MCFCIFGKLSLEEASLSNGLPREEPYLSKGAFTLITHSEPFDQAKYSTTFQASELCFKTGSFPAFFFFFFPKTPPVQKAAWEDSLIREHAHKPDIINLIYYKL